MQIIGYTVYVYLHFGSNHYNFHSLHPSNNPAISVCVLSAVQDGLCYVKSNSLSFKSDNTLRFISETLMLTLTLFLLQTDSFKIEICNTSASHVLVGVRVMVGCRLLSRLPRFVSIAQINCCSYCNLELYSHLYQIRSGSTTPRSAAYFQICKARAKSFLSRVSCMNHCSDEQADQCYCQLQGRCSDAYTALKQIIP